MKTPEQSAKEAWCKLSLGNIARPANFDETVKELAPFFAACQREAIEAAAKVADEIERMSNGLTTVIMCDEKRSQAATANAIAAIVRALLPRDGR